MTDKAKQAKVSLGEFKDKVDKKLIEILDLELKTAAEFTDYAVEYMQHLKRITTVGGKRLRASFVYYTYKMYGGQDFEEIMRIAAAIEMVHVFLLIEDDFMDSAATRRSEETIHEAYKKFHLQNNYKKDAKHFGDSIAVNIGIIADHFALELIINSNFPMQEKLRALKRLNRQIITTGHGQIHDMFNEVRRSLTEQDIINVLYWKTGIYTYDNPIQIGAILAGASEQDLEDLSKYAIPGGVAFQIQDDILGTFGNEDKTGKPADSDIKEGKQTLLTYKAYANGTKKQRELLEYVLGNETATDAEVEEVRQIFIETGALEYTKNKALELVKEAKNALVNEVYNKKWIKEGVDYLEGIADYMIDRDL